jgi:hypothetical protein
MNRGLSMQARPGHQKPHFVDAVIPFFERKTIQLHQTWRNRNLVWVGLGLWVLLTLAIGCFWRTSFQMQMRDSDNCRHNDCFWCTVFVTFHDPVSFGADAVFSKPGFSRHWREKLGKVFIVHLKKVTLPKKTASHCIGNNESFPFEFRYPRFKLGESSVTFFELIISFASQGECISGKGFLTYLGADFLS